MQLGVGYQPTPFFHFYADVLVLNKISVGINNPEIGCRRELWFRALYSTAALSD
jgi:hypothetical protein